jgi:hypothetical protein
MVVKRKIPAPIGNQFSSHLIATLTSLESVTKSQSLPLDIGGDPKADYRNKKDMTSLVGTKQ